MPSVLYARGQREGLGSVHDQNNPAAKIRFRVSWKWEGKGRGIINERERHSFKGPIPRNRGLSPRDRGRWAANSRGWIPVEMKTDAWILHFPPRNISLPREASAASDCSYRGRPAADGARNSRGRAQRLSRRLSRRRGDRFLEVDRICPDSPAGSRATLISR